MRLCYCAIDQHSVINTFSNSMLTVIRNADNEQAEVLRTNKNRSSPINRLPVANCQLAHTAIP